MIALAAAYVAGLLTLPAIFAVLVWRARKLDLRLL